MNRPGHERTCELDHDLWAYIVLLSTTSQDKPNTRLLFFLNPDMFDPVSGKHSANLFWFGSNFEQTLLIQSIVTIIGQLVLLQLIVKIKNPVQQFELKFKLREFWQWNNFSQYISFLLIFTTLSAVMYSRFHIVEVFGLVATFLESILVVPQLWKNYKSRSTLGLGFFPDLLPVLWRHCKTRLFRVF